MNPREPADFPLGRWNLYIGGAGRTPPGYLNLDLFPMPGVEIAADADIRRVFASHRASSARVAEWEHLMKSLQEPSPDAPPGEWWARMEPVFRLPAKPSVVAG